MIKAQDAIRAARSLIGTPYSELDCINLIKKVIRTAPGGVKGYTTAGTNSLWRSFDAAPKYRDLLQRRTGLGGALAGMIAFKADGDDWHHAGIVTDVGTVIHSSSTQGGRGVVETPLTAREGWTHLAAHRYIETAVAADQEEAMDAYRAVITLNNAGSTLNVRDEPGMSGRVIGALTHGQRVTVQAGFGDWLYISYDGGGVGYINKAYALRDNTPEEPDEIETTTLINTITGESIMLIGVWKTADD